MLWNGLKSQIKFNSKYKRTEILYYLCNKLIICYTFLHTQKIFGAYTQKIYMTPSKEKIWKFGWGKNKENLTFYSLLCCLNVLL